MDRLGIEKLSPVDFIFIVATARIRLRAEQYLQTCHFHITTASNSH
jgi:hypothetical protein